MKSFTTLKNLATNLSNNTATANDTLMGQLISDQHRYLIQKFFDNERTYTTNTLGAQDLTFTGALAAGATSGTLSSAWTGPTSTQFVAFQGGDTIACLFSNGSTSVTWKTPLQDASTATGSSTLGLQFYPIPAQISKITDVTVSIGQLKYKPVPVQSRQEWDSLNFIPYAADIPNNFFVYDGGIGIWPIPSTTGNIITVNYKTRVPDLSLADYSTGTVGVTVGDYTVSGSSTDWAVTGAFPTGVDVTFLNLYLRITPPKGDGVWYPIKRFTSGTELELQTPIQYAFNAASGAAYTIGQFPVLQEDFHDMLVYGALKTYFSSIAINQQSFTQFDNLYQERYARLEDYAGTKQINVDLEDTPQYTNPNLYINAPSN